MKSNNKYIIFTVIILSVVFLSTLGCGLIADRNNYSDPGSSNYSFQNPQEIEYNNDGNATNPNVAMDSNGNAIASWCQEDIDGDAYFYVNRYTPANEWEGVTEISWIHPSLSLYPPYIAFDPIGNAVVVWNQNESPTGNAHDVYSVRYNYNLDDWEGLFMHDTQTNNAYPAKAEFLPDGDIFLIWTQSDDACATSSVWSTTYSSTGQNWGPVYLNEVDNTSLYSSRSNMDINPAGDIAVVWRQGLPDREIYGRIRDSNTTWGAPVKLSVDSNVTHWPQVAMDNNGYAIAVWIQSDSLPSDGLWSSLYHALDEEWKPPVKISNPSAIVPSGDPPRIAMNPDGMAIVVWLEEEATYDHVWANYYNAGWSGPVRVEQPSNYYSETPEVAINNTGVAAVVWSKWDDTSRNIWMNWYVSSVFVGAYTIDDSGEFDAVKPKIAMDPSGFTITVWQQWDGFVNSTWAYKE
ncbi:hypothetical protein ACFL20_00275 [Spirochaetota bacterium]